MEPECSLPGWSYESKWWYTETLPFFFLFTLWVASRCALSIHAQGNPAKAREPHVVDSFFHGSFMMDKEEEGNVGMVMKSRV